jgi:hypothetical protein
MITIIKIMCFLAATECFKQAEIKVHPCDRDWSEKSLEAKIEATIGCSVVNGRQVYTSYKLDSIWRNDEV